MPTIKDLVNAVVDDFPSDRHVVATTNRDRFYKVVLAECTLYVPPFDALRGNFGEIDKFSEAVNGFAKLRWEDIKMYEWDNIIRHDHTTEEKCLTFLDSLAGSKYTSLAVDIESSNTQWGRNSLIAIGFAWSDTHCATISVFTPKVIMALQKLFSREDITFIWHNGKFDCGRSKYMKNIDARIDEDTMLKHYACINEKRGTHGLKGLGQLYLQAPAWEDKLDEFKKEWCRSHKILLGDFQYSDIPVEVLLPYLGNDVIATFRLHFLFNRIADKRANFIYNKIIEASNVYCAVENYGCYIDENYLYDLQDTLDDLILKADKEVAKVVATKWDPIRYMRDSGAKSKPTGFNMKSPKQLKWLLEQFVGEPVENTNAKTIEKLTAQSEFTGVGNEFLGAISELRKYNKYMDTYACGMQNLMDGDKRIRCSFNLHGTETGRLSSSDPNMQNIPRDKLIKNLIAAPEGRTLIQLDYSQAELRVLAYLSKDPWLTQVYLDGKDLHDAVATQMFGPDFTKEQRVQAKTINFGIAYGRGPQSLCEVFGMDFLSARKLIDDWFLPMPGVRKFINTRRSMPAKGIECTTPLGRVRHFILTNENGYAIANESVNFPIQSVASDMTLFSVIDIHKQLEQHPEWDAHITLSVHDSIVIEAPDEEWIIETIVDMGKAIMAEAPLKWLEDCEVPFKADAEVGTSWGN